MAAVELIRKQHNGYWKITEAGQGVLVGMDIDCSKPTKATDNQPAATEEPVTKAAPTEAAKPLLQNQPEPTIEAEALAVDKHWPSIELLQKSLPANASLVIEQDGVLFVFAGQQYEIKAPGDFDAAIRMMAMYRGAVAALPTAAGT